MSAAKYHCFISYASEDFDRAELLNRRLIEAGFVVWFDKARLRPGFDWYSEIAAGCEASRVVLPILTPRWKGSSWTKFETYGAEVAIPLFSEGARGETMTPPISRWQGHQLDPLTADDAGWEALFDHIRAELKKPEPDRQERIVDLPYPTNPHFVGREKQMLKICEKLHQTPSAVLTQGRIHALAALGGVGKTTLANEYARRFWRAYRQVLWVDARLGYVAQFARLFDRLFPNRAGQDIEQTEKAAAALAALNGMENRLLVIDNAEDEEGVQSWIPHSGHCRTLITSRFSGWSAGVTTLKLWVLDPEAARSLLLGRTERSVNGDERAACDALAQELGYLPLALEQAAAYINAEGTAYTFAQALALYQRSARELLAAKAFGSTHYPNSVLNTWTVTTTKLPAGSRAILRILACMAATPIPIEVFTQSAPRILKLARVFSKTDPSQLRESELLIRKAIRDLARYSMIKSDGVELQIHNLVQTVEWENTDEKNRLELTSCAVDALDAVFPDVRDFGRKSLCAKLSPHAVAASSRAPDSLGWNLAHLLQATALYLSDRFTDPALWPQAEHLYRRSQKIVETESSGYSPNVAQGLNNLANFLVATNRHSEAEPLLRQALQMQESHLDPVHLDLAQTLNNLGALLAGTNRRAEAEPFHLRALSVRTTNLASDHVEVAQSLFNVANLFVATRRYAKAEPLYRRALAIWEAKRGPDHPLVAQCLNNLAYLLTHTRRFTEAERLWRQALIIQEEKLGPNHLDVARALGSLASLAIRAKKRDEAEQLARRSLAIRMSCLGPVHPEVANSLHLLALLLLSTSRQKEVDALYAQALAIRQVTLGKGHRETRRTALIVRLRPWRQTIRRMIVIFPTIVLLAIVYSCT